MRGMRAKVTMKLKLKMIQRWYWYRKWMSKEYPSTLEDVEAYQSDAEESGSDQEEELDKSWVLVRCAHGRMDRNYVPKILSKNVAFYEVLCMRREKNGKIYLFWLYFPKKGTKTVSPDQILKDLPEPFSDDDLNSLRNFIYLLASNPYRKTFLTNCSSNAV